MQIQTFKATVHPPWWEHRILIYFKYWVSQGKNIWCEISDRTTSNHNSYTKVNVGMNNKPVLKKKYIDQMKTDKLT